MNIFIDTSNGPARILVSVLVNPLISCFICYHCTPAIFTISKQQQSVLSWPLIGYLAVYYSIDRMAR